jgi:hypothetical protein
MRMSRPAMSRRSAWCASPSAALPAIVAAWVVAAFAGPSSAQVSLFDPRFDEVRRASVAWDRRSGPEREVVDMVCLVPDVATFLEVVAAWDERHFFPILIDDVEYTFKFLRAFRPARIVRYPGKPAEAIPPDKVWERAVAAIGKAWSSAGVAPDKLPGGDAVAETLGPVPPGVVVSSPDSQALAGAVALAAGRFQPMLKWETPKHFADALSFDEARSLAERLEAVVAAALPHHDQLGDDCDFVTLAGDYPYRYDNKGSLDAFDDMILRSSRDQRRWAYAGRLLGDPAQSVYRAMCSLFLYPSTALLYNTYSEKEAPWAEYAMSGAATRLSRVLPVTHRNGDRASLAGWHQTFDPINRSGLVLLNSHGGSTSFHLAGGPGHTADIPESAPAAVLMIHSFSAESPADPQTICGRWLANGAFVFFGSMNEPFLQAFRPQGLVASFLAENLPVVTAVRRSGSEIYGQPWRLVYFGDPLYRIRPVNAPPGRIASWNGVADWPAYVEFRQPEPDSPESTRLTWVLRTAIFRSQTAVTPRQRIDLAATLLGIARDRLDPPLRQLHDDLLVDTLLQAGRAGDLLHQLNRVPPGERSASLRRHLETAQMAALQRATAAKDLREALSLWDDTIVEPGARDFAATFTARVARLADTPNRLNDWRNRLRSVLRSAVESPNKPVVEDELKRVEALTVGGRGTP